MRLTSSDDTRTKHKDIRSKMIQNKQKKKAARQILDFWSRHRWHIAGSEKNLDIDTSTEVQTLLCINRKWPQASFSPSSLKIKPSYLHVRRHIVHADADTSVEGQCHPVTLAKRHIDQALAYSHIWEAGTSSSLAFMRIWPLIFCGLTELTD